MADFECTGFEAQNYLKDRCKKCFRLREKHEGLSSFKHISDDNNGGGAITQKLVLNRTKLARRVQSIPTTSSNVLRRVPIERCNANDEGEVVDDGGGEGEEVELGKHAETEENAVATTTMLLEENEERRRRMQPTKLKMDNEEEGTTATGSTTMVGGKGRRRWKEMNGGEEEVAVRRLMMNGRNDEEKTGGKREKGNGQQQEQQPTMTTTTTTTGLAATESGGMPPKMIPISTTILPSPTRQQQQQPAAAAPNSVNSNGKPKSSSSTTTVLLPKQRQISLGGSNTGGEGGVIGIAKVVKRTKKATTTTATKTTTTAEMAAQPLQQEAEEQQRQQQQKEKPKTNHNERKLDGGGGDGNNGNGCWQFMATNDFRQSNGGIATAADMDSDPDDLLSLSSYRTAPSRGGASSSATGGDGVSSSNQSQQGEMFSARSVDSLNSLSYAESFKTGKSPPFEEDDPFVTPTSTDGHFFSELFDARALTPTAACQLEFNHLRLESQRLAEQCRRYRLERKRWTEWLKRRGGAGGVTTTTTTMEGGGGQKLIEEALTELELMVSEYRDENSALKCELDRTMKERELTASAHTLNGTTTTTTAHIQQLEEKLQASEQACEQLRREREELQQEIEEMQDQYRVEEIEEFRELQRELEMNAKNCRILQFKLRKSERQREQLQMEKNLLAKKFYQLQQAAERQQEGSADELEEEEEEGNQQQQNKREEEEKKNGGKEMEGGRGGGGGKRKLAELEQELRVAKEISIKLHNELELAEEKRYRLEDQLFYHKEKVRELLAQNKWREAKNIGREMQQQQQHTKNNELTTNDHHQQQQHSAAAGGHELHREVRDSLEREADLREQLRFTEADLQRTRHRMRELELENDELLQKYTRLTVEQAQATAGGGGGGGGMLLAPPKQLLRSISEGSEAVKQQQKQQQATTTLIVAKTIGEDGEDGMAEMVEKSGKEEGERKDTTADAEQLCYMLAAMDAQANRICKQLEKMEGGGNGANTSTTTTTTGAANISSSKEEKRRSLKGDIVQVMEELTGLLAEMKAIKEQFAKSQNIALTKSMIVGSVLGDNMIDSPTAGNDPIDFNAHKSGGIKCAECEERERRSVEMRESCDFYKRKNADLTEQVLQMKDQCAEATRQTEEEAEAKVTRMATEMDRLRAEMDEQRMQAKASQIALAECRAELACLNGKLVEAMAELERTRRRASGMDTTGMEQEKKWEGKCKEMKAEKIRLQAEVAQLKRRTEEAMQELEKMRMAHQQKEIGWCRERGKLEQQLKQQQQQEQQQEQRQCGGKEEVGGGKAGGGGAEVPIAIGMAVEKEEEDYELKERIVQLEKEKNLLENELAERKRIGDIQQQQLCNGNKGGGGGQTSQEGSSRPMVESNNNNNSGSRVNYKQIADNALKAAESLQKQYREYQRQYTAEVQRLNGQLGQLENELADRERRLREQQQQQQQSGGGGEAHGIGIGIGGGMAAAAGAGGMMMMGGSGGMQQQQQIQLVQQMRARAAESPSMSSLTENTTWDSRLLDCSMTRSISPFKFPRGNCPCPMMQCRTVDIHQLGAVEVAPPEFCSEEDVHREYRRTGSSGTNILYRIRREELSKGKNPSVRQMAKAFDSFEKVQQDGKDKDGQKCKKNGKSGGDYRPLFGLITKASSMDYQHEKPPGKQRRGIFGGGGGRAESPVPSEPSQPTPSAGHCATLPRGGRNPFKAMGSRIVERVRRSLSRSKKSHSRDATPSMVNTGGGGGGNAPMAQQPQPPDEPTMMSTTAIVTLPAAGSSSNGRWKRAT